MILTQSGKVAKIQSKRARELEPLALLLCIFLLLPYSVAGSVFVPHSGQNFAPGASSAWQFAHLAFSCVEPHSEQNFAPSRSSAPHLTHGTLATSIFAPQSPQNFMPAAFGFPQDGHATVCDDCPPPCPPC